MSFIEVTRSRTPLSRHPAFVPLVTLWLGALLGGCVAVLPAHTAAQLAALSGWPVTPLISAQAALAGLAALAGCACGWLAGRTFKHVQHRQPAATVHEPKAPVIETPDSPDVAADETEALAPNHAETEIELASEVAAEVEPRILTLDELFAHQSPPFTPVILATLTPHEVESPEATEAADREAWQPGCTDRCEREAARVEQVSGEVIAEKPQRYGKAVRLLRESDTSALAMPQLVERFAIALDEARRSNANTYLPGGRPAEMARQLRELAQGQ